MFQLLILGCGRPPAFTVVSAEEWGPMVRDEAPIEGRDGGPSGLVFDKTIWTYGDTVLDTEDIHGSTWHTNSWAYADPDDWQEGFTTPLDTNGAPEFLVPLTDEERTHNEVNGGQLAIWPSAPLPDPDGGAWLLFGFFADGLPSGMGVARWEALDQPVERRPGLLFDDVGREWSGAHTVHDAHLWVFGCIESGQPARCALARVPIGEVDQRDAWRFWNGRDWSAEVADAVLLFEAAPISSVGWVDALNSWLLVYSEPFSSEILARSAPELTGPWSRPTVLFTTSGEEPYDASAHYELAEDDGAVQWITYSRPTDGWFGSEHTTWSVDLTPR